jgi:hypothetical protein
MRRVAAEVRIERTLTKLDRLQREIATWLTARRRADKLDKHVTQLRALEGALIGPLAGLRQLTCSLPPATPLLDVYAACRAHDSCTTIVRRIWLFFKAKFDQRDDPTLSPLLAAADEVVWSCYSLPFASAQDSGIPTRGRGAAPLPYIEALDAPEAVLRDEPPSSLRGGRAHQVLSEYLGALPISLIGLPDGCVDEPWWLVYLGHEVGHHVQYDLAPGSGWGAVSSFRELLRQAVARANHDDLLEEDADRWQAWSREIFADVCSVFSMGEAAIWAIRELELAGEATMLNRSRGRYPSPVVRLALLAKLAESMGLEGPSTMEGIDLGTLVEGDHPLQARARRDLDMVRAVVAAVLRHGTNGYGSFQQLYAWTKDDFRPGGDAYGWTAVLAEAVPLIPDQRLAAARMTISGAVLAWNRVAAIPDPVERQDARDHLAEVLPLIVAQNREEGVRAAEPTAEPDLDGLGQKLTHLLLAAVPDLASEESP